MEQQIQDLVDSIRKEGIEEARREKEAILADARAEADRILSSAREKADAMVEEATKECALRQQSAKASLAQAARDVSLALKNTINKELGAILGDSIASALDKDLISRIVSSAVDAGLKDADIVVSAPDAEALRPLSRGGGLYFGAKRQPSRPRRTKKPPPSAENIFRERGKKSLTRGRAAHIIGLALLC